MARHWSDLPDYHRQLGVCSSANAEQEKLGLTRALQHGLECCRHGRCDLGAPSRPESARPEMYKVRAAVAEANKAAEVKHHRVNITRLAPFIIDIHYPQSPRFGSSN